MLSIISPTRDANVKPEWRSQRCQQLFIRLHVRIRPRQPHRLRQFTHVLSLTCYYANACSIRRHPIRSSSYGSFSRPLLGLSAQTVAAPRWSAIILAKSFYHTDTSHLRKNRRPREIRFNGEGSHLGFSFQERRDTYARLNIYHRLKRSTHDYERERTTTQLSKIAKHDEFDFTYSTVME